MKISKTMEYNLRDAATILVKRWELLGSQKLIMFIMNRFKFLLAAFVVATVTLGIYSCGKENKEQLESYQTEGFDFKTLRSFDIWSADKEVRVKVDIIDENLLYMSENDFYISYTILGEGELQKKSETLNQHSNNFILPSNTEDNEIPGIHYQILKNPSKDAAIQIKLIDRSGKRGISPISFTFDGRCSDGLRVCGFGGFPLNCDHTHWYWDKKTATSNLFWQSLYEGTSYNSATAIGYFDLINGWRIFRLKIDPDNNCNSYSSFEIYIVGC